MLDRFFTRDVSDAEYIKFLEICADYCSAFQVSVRQDLPRLTPAAVALMNRLAMFEEDRFVEYHEEIDVSIEKFRYRICEESLELISKSSTSLYGWLQPNLPEDLTFFRKGSIFVEAISHEGFAHLEPTDEECLDRFERTFPGLLTMTNTI